MLLSFFVLKLEAVWVNVGILFIDTHAPKCISFASLFKVTNVSECSHLRAAN